MKIQNIIIFIILLVGLIFLYQKLFPNIITKVKIQYIKGKTDTLRIVKDSLIYVSKWKIKTHTDTFYTDTAGEHASASFNLQNNTVSGVVHYDTPDFSFSNVKIKQKIINNYLTRIDTMKIRTTKIIQNKFHLGIIGGYGIGLQDQKPQFFIGLGASWSIF